MFEKLAAKSNASVAATVIALVAEAGDMVHAFTKKSFPLETTTVTFMEIAIWTAKSRDELRGPPRERFMTAGHPFACACSAAYLIPEMIPARKHLALFHLSCTRDLLIQ